MLIAVAQDHIGRRKAHAAIHALAEAPKLALFPEPVYQPRLAQPCFVDPKLRRTALRTEGAVQLRPVEIAELRVQQRSSPPLRGACDQAARRADSQWSAELSG